MGRCSGCGPQILREHVGGQSSGGWESMTTKWLQHRDFRGLELAVELQESIYMSLNVFKWVKLLLLLCFNMKKKIIKNATSR